MKKSTNITKAILTLLICMIRYTEFYSQDISLYKNEILGHWVSYSGYRQDTIIYVPYHSELANDLGPEIRNSGISFQKNNVCLHHRWKMCGNDPDPDSYPGTWRLTQSNNIYVLTVVGTDKHTKKYSIVNLSRDKIVLVPTP